MEYEETGSQTVEGGSVGEEQVVRRPPDNSTEQRSKPKDLRQQQSRSSASMLVSNQVGE